MCKGDYLGGRLTDPWHSPFSTCVPCQGLLNDYEPRVAEKLAMMPILDHVHRELKEVSTSEQLCVHFCTCK